MKKRKNDNQHIDCFKLKDFEIQQIIPNTGYCFATKKITVEGLNVGYMYREAPEDELDSGWRFFSGTETQDYVDNPINVQIYDVNTIVNYDKSIIPYLNSPIGSEYKKKEESVEFQLL